MPGRWAAPPAPAMSTRSPRPAASCPKASMSRGRAVGRDDAHLVGHAEALEHLDGALHDGKVRRAAHDDGDQRRPARSPPAPPSAGRYRRAPGVPRATAAAQARARTSSASSPHTVTCPSLRPGRAPCRRGGRGRPRRRGRGPAGAAGSAPSAPPKTLTLATCGCWGAVEPSGRSSTARTWFSNCEVTAPSIVQCPELWGRVATSLTSRRPPDQKSSTAMTPTAPAISATFCPRAEAASTTSGRSRPGHEHLAADPAHLRRLDRRPGHRGARGSPGHHDRQLGVERDQLLDTTTCPGHAGQDTAPPRPGRPPATRPCRRSRRGPP